MSAFFSFYNQHLQIANRMLFSTIIRGRSNTSLIFRLESRRVEGFRGGEGEGEGEGVPGGGHENARDLWGIN